MLLTLTPLADAGVGVDVVSAKADLGGYDLIVAPAITPRHA